MFTWMYEEADREHMRKQRRYRRNRETAAAIHTIDCPVCYAPKGQCCRGVNPPHRILWGFAHVARRDATWDIYKDTDPFAFI